MVRARVLPALIGPLVAALLIGGYAPAAVAAPTPPVDVLTVGAITSDTTWSPREARVYIVTADTDVLPDATLTIEPGTIVKVEDNTSFAVFGTVHATGTAERPIILTSIHDDTAGGDTNNDGPSPTTGSWGLDVSTNEAGDAGSFDGTHVDMRYGLFFSSNDFTLRSSTVTKAPNLNETFGDLVLENSRIEGGLTVRSFLVLGDDGPFPTVSITGNTFADGDLFVSSRAGGRNADIARDTLTVTGNTLVATEGRPLTITSDTLQPSRLLGNRITGGAENVLVLSGTLTENTSLTPAQARRIIIGLDPYSRTGLTIPTGTTLTLQPDARLRFLQNELLTVAGNLLILGTPARPVRLTATDTDTWEGITIPRGGTLVATGLAVEKTETPTAPTATTITQSTPTCGYLIRNGTLNTRCR